MMKKFFGSRNAKSGKTSGRKHSGKGKQPATQLNPFLGNTNKEMAAREMMADAEREVYKFDLPTQELGLSDLIAKHKPGDRFQYLAITGQDNETYEARLRRMFTYRPKVRVNLIPSDELPHIKLTDDTESFGLDTVLPKKTEEYIRLVSVSGYFSPLLSVMSTFSKIRIALMDSRFHPPAEIQSVVVGSNMDAKFELSMDYCVPASSAARLSLNITREQATITYGEQWGALQAQIQMEESSFPYMSSLKKVVGVLGPTASAMEEFDVNPNTIDITLTGNDLPQIREMYQSGDIADEDEPITIKKKRSTYSKSSIRALPKGEKAEGADVVKEGWEFMSGFRKPQIEAEIASQSAPSGDDEDVEIAPIKTKKMWEEEQARLREQFDMKSDTTEEIPRHPSPPIRSAMKKRTISSGTYDSMAETISGEAMTDDQRKLLEQISLMNRIKQEEKHDSLGSSSKGVRFGASGV